MYILFNISAYGIIKGKLHRVKRYVYVCVGDMHNYLLDNIHIQIIINQLANIGQDKGKPRTNVDEINILSLGA